MLNPTRFYPTQVRKLIERVLTERLKEEPYDPETAPLLTEEIVKKLRSEIKGKSQISML